MKTKIALISGITGQDGSYLAELLIAKGYTVHGIIRRSSSIATSRIDHLYQDPYVSDRNLVLHYGDVVDGSRLTNLIQDIQPAEIYNLAAQSHVRVSFDEPVYSSDVDALGPLRFLEALKTSKVNTKFYQASSSEMFGDAQAPQSIETAFSPQSPYAAAKVFAHYLTQQYRDAYGIFAVNGILFNHESPRRGETFVTKKIAKAAVRINSGLQQKLTLGNIDAMRDWGYAPEYVVAMWKMLQVDEPKDYLLGTGTSTSVEGFLERAFSQLGMDWREYVDFEDRLLRPNEVNHLRAESQQARTDLDWSPEIYGDELVDLMVDYESRYLLDASLDSPKSKMWQEETGQR